jgi:hypothetical protein
MRRATALLLFAVLLCCMWPASARADEPTSGEAALVLDGIAKRVAGMLAIINGRVAEVARALSHAGTDQKKVRRALKWLCESTPDSVDCVFVGPDGRIVSVEPAEYRYAEGADVSGHDVTVRVRETVKPFLSPVFGIVEGFNAAVLHHPIVRDGLYAGAVSFPVRIDTIVAEQSRQALRGKSGFEVWAVQPDGLIVYAPDAGVIGQNVSGGHCELAGLASRLAGERQGSTFYQAMQGERDILRKEALWTTVGMHGSEWRLVVTITKRGASR